MIIQIVLLAIQAIVFTAIGYYWGLVSMAHTASELLKMCMEDEEKKECSKLP